MTTYRYHLIASGYTTHPVIGNPGDGGAGYQPHRFLGEFETSDAANAAAADARKPSEIIQGTNSTWRVTEDVYIQKVRLIHS